jgi:mono/diheme cytochrome c family protein
MLYRPVGGLVVASAAILLLIAMAAAQTTDSPPAEEPPRDPPPAQLGERMKDAALISQGEKIWKEQCTHCHGAKAYPGKAPKLRPRTYNPEFVWDRTHNGFRAMPPWKDVYLPDEIIAVVAYVLSDDFYP